jgi:hypothetical protein
MFLTVMAYTPTVSAYHWYVLSATAEFFLSRGFQPAPRSAVRESLYSFPDWETFTFTPASSSTSTLDFLQESSYRALGLIYSTLRSAGILVGDAQLQLGFYLFADDALLHGGERSLVLQMLLLLLSLSLPCNSLQGSIGSALDPPLFLEVLHLLLTALSAQLAVHQL